MYNATCSALDPGIKCTCSVQLQYIMLRFGIAKLQYRSSRNFGTRACVRKLNARIFSLQYKNMHVTTVRGCQYENYLIRKFNISRAKYLQSMVCSTPNWGLLTSMCAEK